MRGSAGEHSEAKDGLYDISNRERMGLTEFQVKDDQHDMNFRMQNFWILNVCVFEYLTKKMRNDILIVNNGSNFQFMNERINCTKIEKKNQFITQKEKYDFRP